MVDLLIVGGGINGVGIARDAVGRGLSVMLVEKDDLAAHTSSASTKLVHGGLRYLEYGEFRLVREALIERERLLGMAPHIIWPLEFVLPMRNAPRPAWMIRLGLFLYDHLGGRKILPATRGVRLDQDAMGNGLKPGAKKAYIYSDCWVNDARLVSLNALDAKERGADIRVGATMLGATRDASGWTVDIEQGDEGYQVKARALVNAAGPWVADVLEKVPGTRRDRSVRLVKGSHIIVPRLYEGDHAFLLQNDDKRVVFTIPYEGEYTLVGTTDELWTGAPGKVEISAEEVKYLCATVERYFTTPVTPGDIVWTYAGIRPLYDDSSANASAVTRDYVLDIDKQVESAPMLSIFGGKITTYRKLAEHAMEGLAPWFPQASGAWTAGAILPGGDMKDADFAAFYDALVKERSGLPADLLHRLARAYGTRVRGLLGDAQSVGALGKDFGGGLYQAEVDYLVTHEWARHAEDILYRRSKLGLHVPASTAGALDEYLRQRG